MTIAPLLRRGFGRGSGVCSPDMSIFIVNMPKNASSFVSDWTGKHGWRAGLYDHCAHKVNEVIIILRDPLDRWLSGIAQYINGWILHAKSFTNTDLGPGMHDQYMNSSQFISSYNPVIERLIFDNLERFDDHVWPQSELLDGLFIGKKHKFFYLDHGFTDQFSQYLNIPCQDGLDTNSSANHQDNAALKMFFSHRLEQRPDLKQLIVQRYQQDYELITKVFS